MELDLKTNEHKPNRWSCSVALYDATYLSGHTMRHVILPVFLKWMALKLG